MLGAVNVVLNTPFALGATDPQRVDVRILAATNADLAQLVKEGKFREDLYYRLNVINIALPPLRDRKEDIPPLLSHFFTYYCKENEKFLTSAGKSVLQFQPDAMQVLMEHNWPGNVRELENVVERAVVLASDASVPVDVLPDALLQANGVRLNRAEGSPLPADASLFEIVNEFMTEWARQGFKPSRESVPPLKPVAFHIAGRIFTWEPPEVPRSWD